MAIRGNSSDNLFRNRGGGGGNSFHEHVERMITFRESHPGAYDVIGNNDVRQTCRVNLTISKTGGSATPIGTGDWLDVVPMWKMALSRFSPN